MQSAGHSEQAQAALSGRVPQRALVRQRVQVHSEAMLQAASLAHEELDKLLAQSWQVPLAHRKRVLLSSGLLRQAVPLEDSAGRPAKAACSGQQAQEGLSG